MTSTITACTMDCPDACSLVVDQHADRRIVLRGNPDNPFTAGFTCPKIKHHIKRLRHPARIQHPLLRVKGTWQRITWDAALDLCAEKIQLLRPEPKSILHIKSEGAKGVMKVATDLFFQCWEPAGPKDRCVMRPALWPIFMILAPAKTMTSMI